MTKEEVNLLTLSKYCTIRSTVTGRLYLDKDARCYIFDTEREAAQFCEQMEDTAADEPVYLKQGPFLSLCYSLGATGIRVKTVKSDTYTDISITPAEVHKAYYCHEGMGAILRLKQTKKKKYMRQLKDVPFLAPIALDERKAGEYPTIHYCFATLGNGNDYYLLFTTLDEFEEWNRTQGNQYLANQVTMLSFSRVRNNHPVIINPMSDRLVLTDSQMKEIS